MKVNGKIVRLEPYRATCVKQLDLAALKDKLVDCVLELWWQPAERRLRLSLRALDVRAKGELAPGLALELDEPIVAVKEAQWKMREELCGHGNRDDVRVRFTGQRKICVS